MSEEKPKTEYRRFENESEFNAALDHFLEQPGREMRLFDSDLRALRPNSPARIAQFEHFLRGSRTRRIYIVVHDTEYLTRLCPRMMGLLKLFTHAIQINRTHEEIRNLQDAFLVLDAQHYLRRPVAETFRGALGLYDETEALGMRSRFQEIWSASYPGISGTATGL